MTAYLRYDFINDNKTIDIYDSLEDLLKASNEFYQDNFSNDEDYDENYCKTLKDAVEMWEGSGFGIAKILTGYELDTLQYIEDEIKEHIANNYGISFEDAQLIEDTYTAMLKAYDSGRYDTLLQIRKKILENNKKDTEVQNAFNNMMKVQYNPIQDFLDRK